MSITYFLEEGGYTIGRYKFYNLDAEQPIILSGMLTQSDVNGFSQV
ncbi:MAG TPA: hypothetical protein VKA49_22340 [Flavitalea sp.]|nr:hypothetical protein [Flavitalea sp.]